MWILLSLMALSLGGVWLQTLTSIRWVDHIDEGDMDIFFDRVVIITIQKADENGTVAAHGLTTGVLINNDTVLTSFNPFREPIKDRDARKKVQISVLYERQITDWKKVEYTLKNYSIACARQIIPVADDINIWLSKDNKKQSPLHDLMVIRLNEGLPLISNDSSLYSFNQYSHSGVSKIAAGPMVTALAPRFKHMPRDIKFASLGFIDRRHMNKSSLLRSRTFDAEDNVKTSCDSWMPKEWGHFICIRNIDNYKGVGSGAILISKEILYGIGSFRLKKGKDSILVFTDVRHYYKMIFETCTVEDQALELKTTTTTTTTSTTVAP